YRGDEIRAQLTTAEVSFVFNPEAETPMGTSIALAGGQPREHLEAVLILPADHPAIPGHTIELIVDEWERGATLVQPEYEGRGGHPVLIDQKHFGELLHLDSDRGLRGLFEKHRPAVRRLPVDSPFIARDMDTWEDYLALHSEVFGHLP